MNLSESFSSKLEFKLVTAMIDNPVRANALNELKPNTTKLTLADIICVVDTREQTPWNMAPMQVVRDGLHIGDYSIRGLESIVAIERMLQKLLEKEAKQHRKNPRQITMRLAELAFLELPRRVHRSIQVFQLVNLLTEGEKVALKRWS